MSDLQRSQAGCIGVQELVFVLARALSVDKAWEVAASEQECLDVIVDPPDVSEAREEVDVKLVAHVDGRRLGRPIAPDVNALRIERDAATLGRAQNLLAKHVRRLLNRRVRDDLELVQEVDPGDDHGRDLKDGVHEEEYENELEQIPDTDFPGFASRAATG